MFHPNSAGLRPYHLDDTRWGWGQLCKVSPGLSGGLDEGVDVGLGRVPGDHLAGVHDVAAVTADAVDDPLDLVADGLGRAAGEDGERIDVARQAGAVADLLASGLDVQTGPDAEDREAQARDPQARP